MTTAFSSPAETMRFAIELAERGLGRTEPNPMVGAVLVDGKERLLSAGYHKNFGGVHAEVDCMMNFVERVPDTVDRTRLLAESTIYVTLEPCCHVGKTGPCSSFLIEQGIRRVVVGAIDPAPHVDGGGVRELRNAGIAVEVGVLREECERLIRPFRRLVQDGRPWVHAKWAMTLDGKIATSTGSSRWISNEKSRSIVHELRGRMDGILVGANTARLDDPMLTARPPGPRIATRVVLDGQATLSLDSRLVASAHDAPVLVVCDSRASTKRLDQLKSAGVDVWCIPNSAERRPSVDAVLQELGRRQMTHLLVEGGNQVFGSFFDSELVDECHVFVAPKVVGGDAASPVGGVGFDLMDQAARLEEVQHQSVGSDLYIRGIVESRARR